MLGTVPAINTVTPSKGIAVTVRSSESTEQYAKLTIEDLLDAPVYSAVSPEPIGTAYRVHRGKQRSSEVYPEWPAQQGY